MAGSVSISKQLHRTVSKVTLDWTSDASGDVSGTHTVYLSGQIERVCFIPDSGGTQPTDQYDVTLEDDNGLDVLQGLGANLSNATATDVVPVVTDGNAGNASPTAIDDKLELKVANAGNAKGGKVILYIR